MEQTHRDAVLKLVQASHPQETFDDDEQIFSAIIDDYVEYAKLLEADAAARQCQERRHAAREAAIGILHDDESICDDDIEPCLDLLDRIAVNVNNGDYPLDDFRVALKAIRYDADIAAAELRGRNATIQESLVTPSPSDGIPHLSGADAYLLACPNSIFALASQA